jgi:outer membrane protein assembly factor BamA
MDRKTIQAVGRVTEHIEELLGLTVPADRTIYLGLSNINHMKQSHPEDFAKYGQELSHILENPDYVGQNPTDGSIEYVKEFCIETEYVKVAVRLSKTDRYYARSLYVLNNKRVENFIAKGTLKKT